MVVERRDVGGIPVFLAEAPAPYQAGLILRVGTVDEALPQRGITHICEHLALSSFDPPDHMFNGFVTMNSTHFVTQGNADQVIRYVGRVCNAIRALPLDRLEKERRILLAEEASHWTGGVVGMFLLMRFGAAGYGRCGYQEFGLRAVTSQQVEAWAAERFGAGDAALWLCGPDPAPVAERLSLSLRPGEAHPIPPIDTGVGAGPSWFMENVAGPNLSFLVGRTAAFTVGLAVLHQRLQHQARHERALAYTVGGSYTPLDRDLAHAHVGVDSLPEHHRELTDVFFSVLDEFLDRGPDVAEIEAQQRRGLADSENAFAGAAEAQRMALAALFGCVETIEELRQEMLDVDAEGARRAVADAFGSSLLTLPPKVDPPAGRFTPVPSWSDTEVGGAEHRSSTDSRSVAIVGENGLTCRRAQGQAITVPAQGCEALLRWDDGLRLAIGIDGFKLRIAPWEWRDGERLVNRIDNTFPADRWVPMGPGSGPPQSAAPQRRPGIADITTSRSLALLLLAIFVTAFSIPIGHGYLFAPKALGIDLAMALLLWGIWWWDRRRSKP